MSVSIDDSTMLDRFVQRAQTLYTLPAVAAEVLRLTADHTVDIDALSKCIERDPALTAKILGVVNSSRYGLGTTVTSLGQALTLLGTRSIKLLVLGFSLPVEIACDAQAELLEGYWRHTLLKAVAARELCETLWRQPGDEAFVAGLLQDIGALALMRELGQPYADFLRRVRSEGGNLPALELATLGFDHAILSARLLDHWGLPQSIVRAIALPHDCERLLKLPQEECLLPQVLHVAELLAELLAEGRTAILPELLQVAACYRHVSNEQLQSLAAAVGEKVRQLTESLSVKITFADCQGLLVSAHARLAVAAAGVVAESTAPDAGTQQLWQETRSLSRSVEEFAHCEQHENKRPKARAAVGNTPRASRPALPRGSSLRTDTGRPATTGSTNVIRPTPADAFLAFPVPPIIAPAGKNDPALLDRLAGSVATCRRRRTALSLLLVEIDRLADLSAAHGPRAIARSVRRIAESSAELCGEELACVEFGDGRLVLILEDCDRHQAVTAARRLVDRVRQRRDPVTVAGGPNVTLSVGLATVVVPARNFPPADLVLAAERCLTAAQSSGGDGVKSIDIY